MLIGFYYFSANNYIYNEISNNTYSLDNEYHTSKNFSNNKKSYNHNLLKETLKKRRYLEEEANKEEDVEHDKEEEDVYIREEDVEYDKEEEEDVYIREEDVEHDKEEEDVYIREEDVEHDKEEEEVYKKESTAIKKYYIKGEEKFIYNLEVMFLNKFIFKVFFQDPKSLFFAYFFLSILFYLFISILVSILSGFIFKIFHIKSNCCQLKNLDVFSSYIRQILKIDSISAQKNFYLFTQSLFFTLQLKIYLIYCLFKHRLIKFNIHSNWIYFYIVTFSIFIIYCSCCPIKCGIFIYFLLLAVLLINFLMTFLIMFLTKINLIIRFLKNSLALCIQKNKYTLSNHKKFKNIKYLLNITVLCNFQFSFFFKNPRRLLFFYLCYFMLFYFIFNFLIIYIGHFINYYNNTHPVWCFLLPIILFLFQYIIKFNFHSNWIYLYIILLTYASTIAQKHINTRDLQTEEYIDPDIIKKAYIQKRFFKSLKASFYIMPFLLVLSFILAMRMNNKTIIENLN
jgi:hypothetical protein